MKAYRNADDAGEASAGPGIGAARPGRLGRALELLAPSVFATALACLIAGMIEGALHTASPLAAFAATGFSACFGLPVAFAAALIARSLWHAWRPAELAARLSDPGGGAPRLVAWMLYLLAAAIALASITFNVMRLLLAKSRAPNVIALGTTMSVIAGAAALTALSRPCVQLLTRGLCRLDAAIARRAGRSFMRPRHVLAAAALLGCAALYASWKISVQPRIGHLDLGFLLYPALLLAGAVGLHQLWPRVRRRPRLALGTTAVAGALAVTSIATAVFVRHQRPEVMLAVWGDVPTAGRAIDALYDLDVVRRDMHLTAAAPPPIPGAAHPNLLLITIDTLRADRLAPYGGPARAPTMEMLAEQGTLFEWAFSPGNVTRRSLPTIATGVSPARVRGRVAGWALKLDPRHILLAERLRAAGYDTAGFFCCGSQFWRRHKLGLIRGIDTLDVVDDKDGKKVSARAAAWLAARSRSGSKKPWFMWIHYIEMHEWDKVRPLPPRRPGESRIAHDRRVYDARITQTDRFVKTVLDRVFLRDTVVMLTSDHGEGLSDHGHRYHGTSVYNAQIRVPLIVAGPKVKKQRVKQPVGLVSVAPTLIELAGFVPPQLPVMDGPSIAKIITGEARDDPDSAVAYSLMIRDRSAKRTMRAVIAGRYKLVVAPSSKQVQLYDIWADPDERRNLVHQRKRELERMREHLVRLREIDRISPF